MSVATEPAAVAAGLVVPRPTLAWAADLLALTKPRVVPMISLSTAVGFIVGSGPLVDLVRLASTG